MTILKERVEDIWHIYEKDTGKGKKLVIRSAHSVQSGKKKAIATAAKEKCIKNAEEAAKNDPGALKRFYSDVTKKRCKKSLLRLYIREASKR